MKNSHREVLDVLTLISTDANEPHGTAVYSYLFSPDLIKGQVLVEARSIQTLDFHEFPRLLIVVYVLRAHHLQR